MNESLRVSLPAFLLAGVITLAGCNSHNLPTGTIEKKYYASGPWQVTVEIGGACCDSLGNKYDLYYPTPLGGNGFKHPILTWGSGTFGQSGNYAYFLRHMASWGFAIIATEDSFTGPGQTILDAAKYLVQQNTVSTSKFYQKLDTVHVGSFGHSQGATGAINALLKSGGLIISVLPIELPTQIWCSANCVDTANLTSGSIFLVDGSLDLLISPPVQTQSNGEQSIAAYYSRVPASVMKLKGTLIGPNHNDLSGQPGCSNAVQPCVNGVYGYLGYPTAWFMYKLQADNYAHGAFVNGTGEMFSQTTNWTYVASNVP